MFSNRKSNFSISASDTYGLSLGVKIFLDLIESNGNGKSAEVTTAKLTEKTYDVPEINFLHYNFFGSPDIYNQALEIGKIKSKENPMLFSFCSMPESLYSEVCTQQRKMGTNKLGQGGFVCGYFYDSAKLVEKVTVTRETSQFSVIYSSFEHITSGEEFLYFIVNFSELSDNILAEVARLIEKTASDYGNISVFVVTNITDKEKDIAFGESFLILKSGKINPDVVGEDGTLHYSPLIYTNYDYYDTKEYTERAYDEKGNTEYTVVRFKKLWAL